MKQYTIKELETIIFKARHARLLGWNFDEFLEDEFGRAKKDIIGQLIAAKIIYKVDGKKK